MLLKLRCSEWPMQRPSRTQRVQALPVIRQPPAPPNPGTTSPRTPLPTKNIFGDDFKFKLKVFKVAHATSIADSQSPSASRHPPASPPGPIFDPPLPEPLPLLGLLCEKQCTTQLPAPQSASRHPPASDPAKPVLAREREARYNFEHFLNIWSTL